MLDSSILKDLLAKDMSLVKRLNPEVEDLDEKNVTIKGGMRRYRHKSEMVGEIAIAQKNRRSEEATSSLKLELKAIEKRGQGRFCQIECGEN